MAVLTTNGQWEVGGLMLGTGTKYPIAGVIGLGVPESKVAEIDLPTGDGNYAGPEWLAPRDIGLAIGIDSDPDSAAYDNLIAALSAVWAPAADPVVVRWRRFGRNRRVTARPRGLVLEWDDNFHFGAAQVAARLLAPDPIVYGDDLITATGTGAVSASNTGNRAVWPSITITGPGPSVTLKNNSDGGRQLVLDGLSGDTTVDFQTKTITTGATNAIGALVAGSAWWRVQPGSNSLSLTGAASFTVTFRAGWLSG